MALIGCVDRSLSIRPMLRGLSMLPIDFYSESFHFHTLTVEVTQLLTLLLDEDSLLHRSLTLLFRLLEAIETGGDELIRLSEFLRHGLFQLQRLHLQNILFLPTPVLPLNPLLLNGMAQV